MKSPIPAAEFAEQFPIPYQNPFGDEIYAAPLGRNNTPNIVLETAISLAQ